MLAERARLLRRLARYADAEAAWLGLAATRGTVGALAWVEVAKLREHRLHDLPGAVAAAERARAVADRRRRLGRYDPMLEQALAGRIARLGRRLEARLA